MKKILLILIITIPLALSLDCSNKNEWLDPSGSITDLSLAKKALGFNLLNYDNVKVDCEKEKIIHGNTILDLEELEFLENPKVKPLQENGFEITGNFKKKISKVEFNCPDGCKIIGKELIGNEINGISIDAFKHKGYGNPEEMEKFAKVIFNKDGSFTINKVKFFDREISGQNLFFNKFFKNKVTLSSNNPIRIGKFNVDPLNEKFVIVSYNRGALDAFEFKNAIIKTEDILNTEITGNGQIFYDSKISAVINTKIEGLGSTYKTNNIYAEVTTKNGKINIDIYNVLHIPTEKKSIVFETSIHGLKDGIACINGPCLKDINNNLHLTKINEELFKGKSQAKIYSGLNYKTLTCKKGICKYIGEGSYFSDINTVVNLAREARDTVSETKARADILKENPLKLISKEKDTYWEILKSIFRIKYRY